MTEIVQQQQEEYTVDEYEYQRKKIRKSYIDFSTNREAFIADLEKMMEIIYTRYPKFSVKKVIWKIIDENEGIGMKERILYDCVRDSKYVNKLQKKGLHGLQSFVPVDEEVEKDGRNVREKNDIKDSDEPTEGIEQNYKILQDRLARKDEQIANLKEQIKRTQKEAAFFKHGEIRLDYNKLQQCLRECNESPDFFIITQEKGNAIGVRAGA